MGQVSTAMCGNFCREGRFAAPQNSTATFPDTGATWKGSSGAAAAPRAVTAPPLSPLRARTGHVPLPAVSHSLQSAELGAAVMDANNKVSELDMALEKAEDDLALQLCEFQELLLALNLRLALNMETVTFRELLEGEESRRGKDSRTPQLLQCYVLGGKTPKQSYSRAVSPPGSPAQVSSSHPAPQSCKHMPGANPTVGTAGYRIRLALEAKGVGIYRQTNNVTFFALSTHFVGKVPSHKHL